MRRANRTHDEPKNDATTRLPAQDAFRHSMELIRNRFVTIEKIVQLTDSLPKAEALALQVRKIVEGVAFAALSAAEYRNRGAVVGKRTADADDLLGFLDKRKLLKLPSAQNIEPANTPGFTWAFVGAGDRDMTVAELRAAYSRASALVHERHPERLTEERVANELRELSNDAARLRGWLWLHIMFHKGEGFLVHMGQYGTDSFMGSIGKESDLPAGM